MSDGEALLRAVIDNPGDDAPRLVYADWLDEYGDPGRAEFIRIQCELARWTRHFSDDGPSRLTDAAGRVRSPVDPEWVRLTARERDLAERHWTEWVGPVLGILDSPGSRWSRLFRRAAEPVEFHYDDAHGPAFACLVARQNYIQHRAPVLRRLVLGRGFASDFDLGFDLRADPFRQLVETTPVSGLTLETPGDTVLGPALAGRVTRWGRLQLTRPSRGTLRTVLDGGFDLGVRWLTISCDSCSDEFIALLASSPLMAGVETFGLSVFALPSGLTAGQAQELARNPHLSNLHSGWLTINSPSPEAEAVRILTDRFGPPQVPNVVDPRTFTFFFRTRPESPVAKAPA